MSSVAGSVTVLFVGRAAELAKLTHHLQEARAGQGGRRDRDGDRGRRLLKVRETRRYALSTTYEFVNFSSGPRTSGLWLQAKSKNSGP